MRHGLKSSTQRVEISIHAQKELIRLSPFRHKVGVCPAGPLLPH